MKFEQFLLEEKALTGEIVISEKYKGEHEAPSKQDAPLHDLTVDGTYPDDVYTKPHHYSHMPTDIECLQIAAACKGKPNKSIRIYRAVPLGDKKSLEKALAEHEKYKAAYQRRNTVPSHYKGDKKDYYEHVSNEIDKLTKDLEDMADDEKIKINDGDWVTLSKRYAEEHGKENLKGKYKILSKAVKASQVYTDGNSASEWGYNP